MIVDVVAEVGVLASTTTRVLSVVALDDAVTPHSGTAAGTSRG